MLADDSDTKTAEQGSKSNGAPRQNRREAFFQDFASRAHAHVRSLPKADSSRPPLIMLTGGFRTRKAMSSAVATQATDLVGLGRPSCVKPDLPKLLLDEKVADDQARSPLYEIKGKGLWKVIAPIAIIGPGLNTLWCAVALSSSTARLNRRVGTPGSFSGSGWAGASTSS